MRLDSTQVNELIERLNKFLSQTPKSRQRVSDEIGITSFTLYKFRRKQPISERTFNKIKYYLDREETNGNN